MANNLDELINEMKAEQDAAPQDTPPQDTLPQDTPPQPQDTPPQDTPPQDTPPEKQPNQDTPPQPRPESAAQHAYRRQLEKAEQRHRQELADLNASWEKKFAELKAGMPKPAAEPIKTRADFPQDAGGDDEYVKYLANLKVNEIMAERDAKQAEKDAEAQKARQQEEATMQEIEEQRRSWLANVDAAFQGDDARKAAFLKRVEYCNQRGLGTVLDSCPTAANFLFRRSTGPLVLEKLLSDQATFQRVFNPQSLDPMDIYYELREVEKAVLSQPTPPAAGTPQPAPQGGMPHLGRPGRQAAGNQTPDMFSPGNESEILKFIRGM